MVTRVPRCPIWDLENDVDAIYIPQTRMLEVTNSSRAGGGYTISETLVNSEIIHMTDILKARLTTWLVDQRLQGNTQPAIAESELTAVKNKQDMPVQSRIDRLLRFMAALSETVGSRIDVTEQTLGAFAWTESTTWEEVSYLLDYLGQMSWIEGGRVLTGAFSGTVTVNGYNRIAELTANPDSAQAFVAMWFNEDLIQAYDEGFALGIREAGFSPLRIDQKEHINRIEDEIIAEIRRSRFLVADFTQGETGARGGVYYEAGFAHGLGIPVVFTCHRDSLGDLHFDTSHFSHIVWDGPEDLREQLSNRIRAVIGQGPAKAD